MEGLTTTIRDAIAEIVIDRPARRNALTLRMWERLTRILGEAGRSEEVRVVVLRGAGHDFSAGADISEFDTVRSDAHSARIYEAANSRAFAALRNCPKPTIAAIRGVCLGGGFGLAAACDLRLATPDATFAVPAAKLGLAYPEDAMIDIVTAVGAQMARYLTFTGLRIDAAQALGCGFVVEIVSEDMLDARLEEIARTIAANAPLSISASKLAIAAVVSGGAKAAARARQAGDATFDSADYVEGRLAFAQKRNPKFSGR